MLLYIVVKLNYDNFRRSVSFLFPTPNEILEGGIPVNITVEGRIIMSGWRIGFHSVIDRRNRSQNAKINAEFNTGFWCYFSGILVSDTILKSTL